LIPLNWQQPLPRNIPISVTLLLCKIPQIREVTNTIAQCSNQRVYAVRSLPLQAIWPVNGLTSEHQIA